MRRVTTVDWKICVRLLSALALVLVAFAHTPLNARGLPVAAASAFPDGSIPVICVTLPGSEQAPGVDHGLPCDACLISASIIVPVPADLSKPFLGQPEPVVHVAAAPPLRRAAWPPAAPPQAPPLA